MKRIIFILSGFVALQTQAQQLSPSPADMAALSQAIGLDFRNRDSYTAKQLKRQLRGAEEKIPKAAADLATFMELSTAAFDMFGNPKNLADYLRENGMADTLSSRISEYAFYLHSLRRPADAKLASGFGYGVKMYMDTARTGYYIVTIAKPGIELRKYRSGSEQPVNIISGRLTGNTVVPHERDTTLRLFFLDGVLGEYNGSNVAQEYFECSPQGVFTRSNTVSAFDGIIPEDIPTAVAQLQDIKNEEPPYFPGGDAALNEYFSKNTRYPEAARKKDVTANMTVSFVIDPGGKVRDAKVMGEPRGYGLDEEALRVINAMPDWLPGRQGGKNVAVQFRMPVRFGL
ncbi:energy transducer TonB [Chitinophaga rhizosphaerae]|uniref:energy transducer TonB n=1 Tax=Chitinophaga rhizosphaerae TaxID=1864947 RepID=UPI000F811190|nr:energy transducer TonB [Chitinophaga rhizosphaerae]